MKTQLRASPSGQAVSISQNEIKKEGPSSSLLTRKSADKDAQQMSPRLLTKSGKGIVTAPKDSINSVKEQHEKIKLQDVTANEHRLETPDIVLRSELGTMKILIEEQSQESTEGAIAANANTQTSQLNSTGMSFLAKKMTPNGSEKQNYKNHLRAS